MAFPKFSQKSHFNTPNILAIAQASLENMYHKSLSYPWPYYQKLEDDSFNILALEIQEMVEYEIKEKNDQVHIISTQIKPLADITPVIIKTRPTISKTKKYEIALNYEALGLKTEKEQYDYHYERYMEDIGSQTFNVDTRAKRYLYAFILDNQLVEINCDHMPLEQINNELTQLHSLIEQDWLKNQIKISPISSNSNTAKIKI